MKTSIVLLMMIVVLSCMAQTPNDVMLLKNPNNGKWGYASKDQNRKSPIRGLRKTAVNLLGKNQGIFASGSVNLIDWVVPAQYDAAATDFEENLAAVEIGGKVGFIDVHNRFIIEPKFEPMKNLEGFSQGMAAVKIGDKYGYIDKRGEVIIEPEFELARNFRDNMLATVKKDGKYGAIDIMGNLVVECKYVLEEAMIKVPISNKEYREAAKVAKQKKDADEYAPRIDALQVASREANKRINDSVWSQTLTYSTCVNGEYKGVSDNYGRVIIPPRYLDVHYDKDNHLYIVDDDYHNLKGVYSDKGDVIFYTLFDSIASFKNGKANAIVEGVCGWIDKDGYIEPEFLDKLCDLGLQQESSGDKRAARETYRRILRIDHNHVMALNNMALLDIDAHNYNDGISRLKLANKLAPDNKLIAENLEMAKHDRKERRWNRLTGALTTAMVVTGVTASTYAVTTGGSEGLKAANHIMSDLNTTLDNMENGTNKPLGQYDDSVFDVEGTETSQAISPTEAKNKTKKKAKDEKETYLEEKAAKAKKDADRAPLWRNASKVYDSYVSQLVTMNTYPEKYYNDNERKRIQSEMKRIRKDWEKKGFNITYSEWEDWIKEK
jgi:hypothetical protein